jgi:peptidoglycan/xylan/chitin deacetylase (PgdA/CDA1 family)
MRFDRPVPWPDGARCAVMLTFDVDAELIWLAMDPSVAERPKTLSIGEYGPRRGVRRILDVLGRHDLRTSWMIPGRNAETYPEVIRAVAEAGHEIGNHGYLHENFADLTVDEQREVLLRGNDAIERVSGTRPRGYRTPAGDMTPETPQLLVDLGFEWSSSMRGDDRPSFITVDGAPTDVVEIPAHWELDDFPYFMFNYDPPFPAGQCRIASYADVLDTWISEFDAYYDLGLCFVSMFHPQTIGTPGRIALLDELISHMRSRPDVWFATGAEVAEWWRSLGRPNDPGSPEEVFARGELG